MVKDELLTYMGYEWVLVDDGVITIGINDQGLEEFTDINGINMPTDGEEVITDEVCGELDTDQGPMNLYSPVEGNIVEINEAVIENPSLIMEDPYGDGWLFKVEPKNAGDLDELLQASTNDKDE
jgi:glycine cleavage system H protein